MDCFERRQSILEILSVKRKTTCSELMKRFGVTRKTLRKDIEMLQRSVPIYTSKGNDGGVFVIDSWKFEHRFLLPEQEKILIKTMNSSRTSAKDKDTILSILNDFSAPWSTFRS